MSNLQNENRNESSQNLQVWSCENCQSVHFKAGNVLLNFSKAEFTELTHAVLEIFQKDYGSLEFYHLISAIQTNDDILLSQSIA